MSNLKNIDYRQTRQLFLVFLIKVIESRLSSQARTMTIIR